MAASRLIIEGKWTAIVGYLAQRFVYPFGGVAAHRGHSVRVPIEFELYGGVVSEVLGVLRMRARVSSIVKKLCLC